MNHTPQTPLKGGIEQGRKRKAATFFLRIRLAVAIFFMLCCRHAAAQTEPGGVKIFGYFQAALGHQKDVDLERELNSFTLQQLNLFLQKDLGTSWSAFINFELVNSYSSQRNWGGFSLEEAWVNYRYSNQFKLKLGLLTPAFNNLNEIKTKTPLLPYIIRPYVYESSFGETDFVPGRAFVQAYGFIPKRAAKLEYAFYIGNSPNVNTDGRRTITGVDTSRTFLFGGRIGMRYGNFKAGISATRDKLDAQALSDAFGVAPEKLKNIARLRRGADLSFSGAKWLLESEYIHLSHSFPFPQEDFDQRFFYATLGYSFSERVFGYASYWYAYANVLPIAEESFQVPTLGATYKINDMVVCKIQTANVYVDETKPKRDATYNYTYFAISVRF